MSLYADIMIGPLSGDESIAVANYAKQHPTKTFVDGAAGAQDTTLKVQAPNFFRFNGDGAMWNAGLGDLAYNKLHWKTAAVVADDYSFAWTSAAGFIAEFCAVGRQAYEAVFPPLNTTDYSSYAQQMPTNVDGTFVAVGGAGLIPFLKAYEQAHGPIDGKKFIGNLFWGTPGEFQQLGARVAGAYVGGAGTAGDLATPAAQAYSKQVGRTFHTIPPFGAAAPQASSTFTYGYYINAWACSKGLGWPWAADISGGRKALQDARSGRFVELGPYGPVAPGREPPGGHSNVFYQQLYLKDGKLAVKTVGEVPGVTQTFGGLVLDQHAAAGPHQPALHEAVAALDREGNRPEGHLLEELVSTAAVTESAAPILRLRGVGRRYGGLVAVRDVDLDVAPGERRAVLGPNGAGKTTLFNVISGDVAPSSGTIEFRGQEVGTLPPRLRAQLGMGRTYQKSRSFLGLTVEDNLYLAVLGVGPGHRPPVIVDAAGAEIRERARELVARSGSTAESGASWATLSHGEQRQLEVGMARAGT